MKEASHYENLGELFRYPDAGYAERVKAVSRALDDQYPGPSEVLKSFAQFCSCAPLAALEELYVHTFDVQSICTLDVGYAMFGEDYRRGLFMAHLRQLHQKYDVDCGLDLPDFLPNVLRLLPHLPLEDRRYFVETALVPALAKMLESFKEDGNVFRKPLETLRDVVKKDFQLS